jgi:hypothetical protein
LLLSLVMILISKNLGYIVFKRDDYVERFRLIRPSNLDQFLLNIEKMIFNREESGIDSDSFNIFDAEYIDCYPI